LGWAASAQALLEGVRYATFDHWGLLALLTAGAWLARATDDAHLRRWLLVLPGFWALSLLSTASIQVVAEEHHRLSMFILLAVPLLGLAAHVVLLIPDGGRRLPRLLWGALNLTFACRAALYLGSFV
jgi:hypothetical protein